jgi:hypothetical protein
LEKETLFTNGLAMELLDDLLADITRFKTRAITQTRYIATHMWHCLPGKANSTAVIVGITQNSARADSVVHEDSTKLLL